MDKKYYSLSEFSVDQSTLLKWIRSQQKTYSSLYAIPQGGVPLGLWLSSALGIPMVERDGIVPDTLVVDDIIDSGRTRMCFPHNDFVCLHAKNTKVVRLENKTFAMHRIEDNSWIVYWWEGSENRSIADSVVRMLQFIGEDPNREGLVETPSRVTKMWNHIFSGYQQTPDSIIKTFDAGKYDEMVLLKDIEMYSMCEHHLMPFFGKSHVAYVPDKKVIGISKLARLVDMYARRVQIQERICEQVTEALMAYLQPKGAACVIEAQHLCMKMRGVEKQNSVMITSSLKGVFLESGKTREEFMRLIK